MAGPAALGNVVARSFCFNDSSLYILMASDLKSEVSVSDGHMPSVLFGRGSGR